MKRRFPIPRFPLLWPIVALLAGLALTLTVMSAIALSASLPRRGLERSAASHRATGLSAAFARAGERSRHPALHRRYVPLRHGPAMPRSTER